MTQETTLDPFALWKNMYEKTEANLNDVIHETLQKEAFSEWLGNYQNAFLQYQSFVQKTTENYLKQINMPTREEISSVASLIINVEEKIENLDQKVEDELLTNPSTAEINKLKVSVSKLDKKMDQILKLLQQNEKKAPPVSSEVQK
ncbi:polyhydroxyalkanoate biosynthesis repressor PhaR [Bacillus aerolatus]|uniref:Poly(3-hydroxyalkanoate) polymerase subunit PhaE n=1 Tax=Bacillus aerolatus TaxID=2653354 RepID=A0A6I1FRH2_9BACI|nr:poly(R)-hydroxyalkanoic acid synthase subunit PhaE [Bacillus aerolatus]KAB7707178.1 polyhydroxyalkanoate biosynthesis repressor PhaR [Bacillus aerolatus]